MTAAEIMDAPLSTPAKAGLARDLPLNGFIRAERSYDQTTGRRFLGGAIAIGVQVVFIGALAYGTMHEFKPKSENLTVVSVVEESKVIEEPEVAAPPPKFETPVIQVQMPLVTITEPPPAPNAPTAVVTQAAPALPTPIARPHGDGEAAILSFQQALLRHLHRHLRYPPGARAKREQGVVYVRFAMDRHGRVKYKGIDRRSKYIPLDEEAIALLERAQPLPTPPLELGAEPPEMVVPVEFSLRTR